MRASCPIPAAHGCQHHHTARQCRHTDIHTHLRQCHLITQAGLDLHLHLTSARRLPRHRQHQVGAARHRRIPITQLPMSANLGAAWSLDRSCTETRRQPEQRGNMVDGARGRRRLGRQMRQSGPAPEFQIYTGLTCGTARDSALGASVLRSAAWWGGGGRSSHEQQVTARHRRSHSRSQQLKTGTAIHTWYDVPWAEQPATCTLGAHHTATCTQTHMVHEHNRMQPDGTGHTQSKDRWQHWGTPNHGGWPPGPRHGAHLPLFVEGAGLVVARTCPLT